MPRIVCEMSEQNKADFSKRPVVGQHRLQQNALFTDEALVDLLNHFPREHLYAFSMGVDPEKIEENHRVEHEGVSGEELLLAVRNGRLWLNVTRVDRVDARYRRLISDLYDELRMQVSGFYPTSSQGTLLISSPKALVYYHADGPSSALWHLRGRKRVWVYPALDSRYMQRELLEDIFAGVRHEYLPYEVSYDEAAQVYDLEPGQWICWPQNAPHRVTNLNSINVSLSTEHFTVRSCRRFQLYMANRYFRTHLGCNGLSSREDGAAAMCKILVQRAASKLGLNPLQFQNQAPVLRVEPNAPGGVVALDESRSAERSA